MRTQREICLYEIGWHEGAGQDCLEDGARLFDLSHGAVELFQKREATEKRHSPDLVRSDSAWEGGEFTACFSRPFDLLAETAERVAAGSGSDGLKTPGRSVWLGDLDSNQDQRSQSPPFYR